MLVVYILTAAALLLLAMASWRKGSSNSVRAGLAVLASAGLSFALTGSLISVALLAFDVVLVAATWRLAQNGRMKSAVGTAWIVALVLVLLVAKLPGTQAYIGVGAWVGISYLIFRLLHVAFDARRERLGDATLSETLTYALHPATLTAGPIDRVQHNVAEQRHESGGVAREPRSAGQETSDGLWRLFI